MCKAKLPDSEDFFDRFIEDLASLSILGKETRENSFEFEYDLDNKDIINVKSRKLNSNRYKIHNALVPYLDLNN